jgi:KUP system potassium uptake protein
VSAEPTPGHAPPTGKRLAGLSLAALGVVYGDIGTSPLYALKECFSGVLGVEPTPANVLGVISLVFWSLNFLISYKYIGLMLRADNRGEGGILALIALLGEREGIRGRVALFTVGLFGAALLYGDGIITPAISVLGAVEGLAVATPVLAPWVLWISLAIIIGLFAMQKGGTGRIGRLFGPITTLWFFCIAALGIAGIVSEPRILAAVNPWHAVSFFAQHGLAGFLILAVVVLVVTGGEALYADMGHFGKRPIRAAWFAVVLPALLLNYFGQGALLLRAPEAAGNPFYNLVPTWGLYPMVVIATGAAITASQALISGAFSLTQQAVQLGYCPRVTIRHTSRTQFGQIYIPEVNTILAVACVGLVLGFQNTTNLAGAYGVAVTGTMTIGTLLFAAVAREQWRWPWWKILAIGLPILVVDLAFAGANLTKLLHGGWFPLLVAASVFALMSTWKRGRQIVSTALRAGSLPLDLFTADLSRKQLVRVPGTAVFMTSDASGAPPVLLHHLKHNKVLHERVVIMSVITERVPTVPKSDRLELRKLGEGIWVAIARYGFMETPSMAELLEVLEAQGMTIRPTETSFYLGRETLFPTGKSRLARWRKKLFIVMARNARGATAYFGLPPNRVVELGAQIQL